VVCISNVRGVILNEARKHVSGAHASNAEQGREHASDIVSFASDTANKIGVSSRTVEREIQIAKNLIPDTSDALKRKS